MIMATRKWPRKPRFPHWKDPSDMKLDRGIIEADKRGPHRDEAQVAMDALIESYERVMGQESPPEYHCPLCNQRTSYAGLCDACEREWSE